MSMRRPAMSVSRAASNARRASGWAPLARRSDSHEGAASVPTVAIVTGAIVTVAMVTGAVPAGELVGAVGVMPELYLSDRRRLQRF
jgi:hypothetical protein